MALLRAQRSLQEINEALPGAILGACFRRAGVTRLEQHDRSPSIAAQIMSRIGENVKAGREPDLGAPLGARECALRELRYWKTRRARAELAPRASADEVTIGTRVRIRLNGVERTISVVGHDEAYPAEGFVSYSAPLAKALLGAGVGDQLPFAGKDGATTILKNEMTI